MRRQRLSGTKGLVSGVILGFLLGSVVVVGATLGREGWLKQDQNFQLGYIVGFTDAVRMTKSASPGTYLDNTYRLPVGAKPRHWLAELTKIFESEEGQNLSISQALAFAGPRLEKVHGQEKPAGNSFGTLGEVMARRRAAIADGTIPRLTEEQLELRAIVNRREKKLGKCKRECRKGCRTRCVSENKAEFDAAEEAALKAAAESVRRRDAERAKKQAEEKGE